MTEPRDPHLDLLDDARLADALAERSRDRSLRQRATDTASLAGTLRDLAERATPVVVATVGGRRHRGQVRGVAADHVVLDTPAGRVHLRREVLATIRPQHGAAAPPAQGERDAVDDLLLGEVLARIVGERPTVVLGFDGATESVRGRLDAVGEDVATVRVDGGGELVYVPIPSVTEVIVER